MAKSKVVYSSSIGNAWHSSTSYDDNRRKQNTKTSKTKRK